MTNFNVPDIYKECKDEYLNFLEDVIQDQRHEVAVIYSHLFTKPKITTQDFITIVDEMRIQTRDLFMFNKFVQREFKCSLLHLPTILKLKNVIVACQASKKEFKKK